MSITVRIPPPLQRHTDGAERVIVAAETVGEALGTLEVLHPGVLDRVLDARGALRDTVTVYLNEEDVGLLAGFDTRVRPGDEVRIAIAARSGGAVPVPGTPYSASELEEIEELNNLPPDHRPFFHSVWWRRAAIALTALLAAALLLPGTVLSCNGGDGPTPTEEQAMLPVPDFELAAAQGGTVRLSETLRSNDAVVLVFYRGHF